MVLAMVYNSLNHWVYILCSPSWILNHKVSETASASFFRWGKKMPILLGPLERVNLNHWTTHVDFVYELYCDRRSVGQFVLVPGLLWGRWPDFKFIWLTITSVFLHVERPLGQWDGSVACSAITHWLESLRTHNHTLLSHLGLPQPRGPSPLTLIPLEQGGPAQNQSRKSPSRYDRRSVTHYILVSSPLLKIRH
jgi:hypothetical protein